MAHIVLDEEHEIYWGSSNSIFKAVVEEAMKEVGEDSLSHKFLFVEMLHGGLDFYKLEEQEQQKFFNSTQRLLEQQKKRLAETPKKDYAYPYIEGMLNKLEELVAKIEEVIET